LPPACFFNLFSLHFWRSLQKQDSAPCTYQNYTVR
jgi:hypothetical protein